MKKLLVILGMHRSGTSVTAKICQHLGAYLGEEKALMSANKYNPDGYFENMEICYANDNILYLCGKEWYSLEPIDIENPHQSIITKKDELKNIINKLFEKNNIVAVKDPRIAVLLPLWKEVLEELEVSVKYIWVFRNPLEVSYSLRIRDGYSRNHSLLLWIYYNLNIMKFLKNRDYVMINYNRLPEDFRIVKSLGDFFHVKNLKKLDKKIKQIVNRSYAKSSYSKQDVDEMKNDLLSKLYDTLMENKVQEADTSVWEEWYIREINKTKTKYADIEVLQDIGYLKKKKIFIYGAGNYGRRAAEILQQLGILKFDFCDKDGRKHGKNIMGGKVLSIEEVEKRKNILVIIAVADKEMRKEIEQTLVCIEEIRIISFFVLEKLWKYYVKDYTTTESKIETICSWYDTLKRRGTLIKSACKCPVLVYQNGKVGSSTVSEGLRKAGVENVHIHRFFFQKDIVGQLMLGEKKRDFIESSVFSQMHCPEYVKCIKDEMKSKKVITLVREPVAVDLSTVFQWIGDGVTDRYFAEQIKKGYNFSQIVLELMMRIQNRIFEWFYEELKELSGVNIFDYPFDQEKGYTIIWEHDVEILLIKAEKLSEMTEIIRNFVGNPKFEIQNVNVGKNKEYAHIYKGIKQNIRFPKEYISAYYNDNFYMDYFYSKEEQRYFLEQWKRCIEKA